MALLAGLLILFLTACQEVEPGVPEPLPPLENPALKARLEASDALRIMPLGDSITEGFCDQPDHCESAEDSKAPHNGAGTEGCANNRNILNPDLKGYRKFLRDRLVAAGVNMTYVGSVQVAESLAHEGHGGFNLFDIEYCIQNAGWLEEAKPDIILLHIGTNDAVGGEPLDTNIANLRKILEGIYQKMPETTEVIVAQIIPTREGIHVQWDQSKPLANDVLAGYNAAIPAIVEEFRARGKHISFVDMQPAIQSQDEYDEQGLHPNPVAHERMAQVWFEKIMEIVGR